MKLEARQLHKKRDKYTKREKNAVGRMRVILKSQDPQYPDTQLLVMMDVGDANQLRNKINKSLKRIGINCQMLVKDDNQAFDIWNCKLTKDYIAKFGINHDPIQDRDSDRLGFEDVFDMTHIVNEVMDAQKVNGNVIVKYDNLDRDIVVREGDMPLTKNLWHFQYHLVKKDKFANPLFIDDILVSKGLGRKQFREENPQAYDVTVIEKEEEPVTPTMFSQDLDLIAKLRARKRKPQVQEITDRKSPYSIREGA